MYRNFLRNLSKKFISQNNFKADVLSHSIEKLQLQSYTPNIRTIYCNGFLAENSTKNNDQKSTNVNPFQTDEYIITQSTADSDIGLLKISDKNEVVNLLRYTFRISDKDILKLLPKNENNINWDNLKVIVEILCKKGVYKKNIIGNAWLFKSTPKLLETKFEILNSLQMKDVNDFVPLLRHSVPRLQKVVKFLNNESKLIPIENNRLYYISSKLDLDPHFVCNYLSKRLFILEMPFDMLQENLNYMIQYGIEPLSIIKDLWAFRYTPKSVKARLERAKDAKKNKIMPWMVRCPERILQKSLKLSLDEIKILGENKTVVDYLAQRLEIDRETIRCLMEKDAQLSAVRVTKIKEILDYLIDEEGLSKHSIAQVLRILCHGLDTTKKRLEELKAIGCKPTSMVILCRSRREYEKFVKNWLLHQERIKQRTAAKAL